VRDTLQSLVPADMCRLLPTATSLLIQLTNPLNLTLLASQLLTNDRFFSHPTDLLLCRRIFSTFYTAALRVVQDHTSEQSGRVNRLSINAWAKSVIQGADEKSPRWRHVILIGGILLGLGGQQQRNLSSNLRTKLEFALVIASNLALEENNDSQPASGFCVVFVLNHTFGLLSDLHRSQLRYDLFLPLAVDATFFSREGFERGYWLGMIDGDVRETTGKKFNWSPKSSTFLKTQDMKSKILISSLGPLSRLIAHSIDHVNDSSLVVDTIDRLTEFARILAMSWRQNKLSEVDVTEEADFLDAETLGSTMPLLWQTLREVLFAIVVLLRATLGRLLCDPILSTDSTAPLIAMQSLHILRYLNFIAARLGQMSTSQYVFVNFTAIDILNQFPDQAESFLRTIQPANLGYTSSHPLERYFDLFFLNTAEHFTLTVKSNVSEDLLLAAAMPYVSANSDKRSVEVYEAAHSVLLAVFAAPQNSNLASRHLPFYVETLMQSFPRDLSPRQLRLAIKSILRIVAPPSPIINALPLMPSIVLDLIHNRAITASSDLLPTSKDDQSTTNAVPLSEQSALILALIDSLPYLSPAILEEWLPLTAPLINKVMDPVQKSSCQQRFWEVLSSGEMDVERAAICVAWWTTRGGRELTLYNDQYAAEDEDDYMMTGALQNGSRL
jgi:hypothetical protein